MRSIFLHLPYLLLNLIPRNLVLLQICFQVFLLRTELILFDKISASRHESLHNTNHNRYTCTCNKLDLVDFVSKNSILTAVQCMCNRCETRSLNHFYISMRASDDDLI
jgi:hypothetical protein